MTISTAELLKISKYLSVIHHSRGRLRVRISPEIVKLKDDFDGKKLSLTSISDIPKKINGIKDVKVIPLMGSVTINYDDSIFPMKLWEDLISGDNLTETTALLNKLAKEIA
ncbi:MAG: hypothetical protein ACK5LP_04960 [Campylobacteraceae bacterium]